MGMVDMNVASVNRSSSCGCDATGAYDSIRAHCTVLICTQWVCLIYYFRTGSNLLFPQAWDNPTPVLSREPLPMCFYFVFDFLFFESFDKFRFYIPPKKSMGQKHLSKFEMAIVYCYFINVRNQTRSNPVRPSVRRGLSL